MKTNNQIKLSVLFLGLALSSVNAKAMSASEQQSTIQNGIQLMQTPQCINHIQMVLKGMSYVPFANDYFADNLANYAQALKYAQNNLRYNVSPQPYYDYFRGVMKNHADETYSGGKYVVDCLRPHLNFSPKQSRDDQLKTINVSLRVVNDLQKAIQ